MFHFVVATKKNYANVLASELTIAGDDMASPALNSSKLILKKQREWKKITQVNAFSRITGPTGEREERLRIHVVFPNRRRFSLAAYSLPSLNENAKLVGCGLD